MSEADPTPHEAQAALAEANTQAARVRRSDHQLALMLLGIVAVYLAAGAVISTLPSLRRGGPIVGLAVLAIVIVGVVGMIYVGVRIRAYSRAGIYLYFGGVAAFNVWNAIVTGVSIGPIPLVHEELAKQALADVLLHQVRALRANACLHS